MVSFSLFFFGVKRSLCGLGLEFVGCYGMTNCGANQFLALTNACGFVNWTSGLAYLLTRD